MIRTEISGAEIAEEMEKERRFFQLQMCEVRVNVKFILFFANASWYVVSVSSVEIKGSLKYMENVTIIIKIHLYCTFLASGTQGGLQYNRNKPPQNHKNTTAL